ncbi:MAG: 3-dehydroquinate synthase [Hyphomicrobiaceae bacterium]
MTATTDNAQDIATRTVRVGLGDRTYDIHLGPGLLDNAASLIGKACGPARCAVLTDENVAAAQLAKLEKAFAGTDRLAGKIVLPAGEATKCFAQLESVCDQLLALGIERGDVVIALGGGVIGDLAGFAASILRRGVRMVQIPTSLLAQVDSSIGGKTGINTARGKNLIGTFHQPSLVLADTDVLETLPDRQLRAGYAEVVKYGLLGDRAFFDWLEDNLEHVLTRDPAALLHAIETSCKAKTAVVAADVREQGQRALLNLGHTFGYALEAWAGFSDRLLHGEAISIGMVMAFRFSERTGLLPGGQADAVEAHFRKAGLPTRIAEIPSNKPHGETPEVVALEALMAQDKKVERGRLKLVLVRAIGDAFVTDDVDAAELRAFLADEIGR